MDPKNKYDVAVLGWWYGKNYGSILTYYGLNRAIKNLGYSVLMVHEPVGYNGYRVRWPDNILSMDFARRIGYEYTEQMHYSELNKLNDLADTFVVGSDQLWNPLIGRVNDDLFLDFVAAERNRVAYGTSFGNRGTEKFKPDFVAKHSQNLQQFKAISVRESYGIDTARDIFGAKAELVVDPVFLLEREHYSELAAEASISPNGEYMAVFLLDPTPEKKSTALAIMDKVGLEKILVICNPDEGRQAALDLWADEPRAEIIASNSPENFLRAYRDSSYVVTDSFHGTAFSVIFEKPFSSIYNNKRGADRFKNLLSSLGFDDTRRVYESDTTQTIGDNKNVTREIDFGKARSYIENGRLSSLEWLRAAIDPSVKSSAALVTGKGTPPEAKSSVQSHDLELDFEANSDVWSIGRGPAGIALSVKNETELRGKHVWTDLPEPLTPGSRKRLKIQWSLTTQTKNINVHLRNPESGKFRVVGKATLAAGSAGTRTDEFEFSVVEAGYSQVMFGALHFTGPKAGAEVHSISISEAGQQTAVPAAQVTKSADDIVDGFSKQARRLALHDFEQQVRSFGRGRSSDSVTGIRARMFFHAHAIEKGLTHSNFRPGFGRIAIPGLAKEMNAWLSRNLGSDDTILQSSASVMKAYFARNSETNTDVSHFRDLFSAASIEVIENGRVGEGGAFPAAQNREDPVQTPDDERPFMDVMYGRRSVREFTQTPVDDSAISAAVQIAMQSPSVCSRQGARVHQFDDPEIIKQLLEVQGGFFGFNAPPRLLLVSADLDAFLFAPERNQPFVDGGLFMMSLLLGLTQMELGSCLLNTAMGVEKEQKIRTIVDIPENEVFIAFVAVGNFDNNVLVPRSKRVDADSVLTRHA